MSRSNRLYNLALRGCLIAAVLWVSLAYAQEGTGPTLESQPVFESGQQASKSQATNQGQQTKSDPGNISPALNQIEAAIRDLITQQRTAQGKGPEDHEISDLEAQEGMAFWAQTMFWATLAAVIVTFAGIVLIWRTLHHTRRAADYTKGMLEEAKKTTTSAIAASRSTEDSVGITRETAQLELRAYLSAEPEGVNQLIGRDEGMGHVFVRNVGKLPARNVRVEVSMKISGGREADFPTSSDDETVNRVIQPSAGMGQGSRHIFPETIG